MDPKEQPSDQPIIPKPPQPSAQQLGYPPGSPQGNLGYPQAMVPPPPSGVTPPGHSLGYPQMPAPSMGYPPAYPMSPGMMPPPSTASSAVPVAMPAPLASSSPIPVMPAPRSMSSAVPIMAASAEEDGVAAAAVAPEGEGEVYFPPPSHIAPGKRANPLVRAWRKVGGGSLALSIAIHAGVLLVGGAIVVSTQMIQRQVDFLPGGSSKGGDAASADMQHKVQQKKRSKLNKSTAMKKITTNSLNSSVNLPDAPPDLLDLPDMGAMLGGGSLGSTGGLKSSGFGKSVAGMGANMGFVSLPPSMRSRCSTQERLEKLRQNGGNPECERAVSQSLEWLKTQQNADGSWGKGNKAAYTGLSLLCYLGRCETPDSPFYGENVMKGIMYLIELSKKNEFGIISETPQEGPSTYEHGIATYALGEMYTLARLGAKPLPGMREAFEKGVTVIIENQTSKGSWTYGGKEAGKPIGYNKDSGGEDLSVAGWQFQALKAAKNTGLKIPGLHAAIEKCTDYVLSKQTKDGGFGVADRDQHYNQYSLTGAGSLFLQTMTKGKTAPLKKAIDFLHRFLAAEPLDWNKNCNLYCWYYYTQTFFQAGGEEWKFYNEQFLPQILANQSPDGSFKKGRPNWPAGDAADPIYRQALCTLQLEVYYRYLKVADREEESFFDK